VLVTAAFAMAAGCSSELPPIPATNAPPTHLLSTSSPSAVATPSPQPTPNENEVVLRLSRQATLAPAPGRTVEPPAMFTLYADGRAIYVDYVVTERDGTVVSLQQAQLSEDQVSELIAFALADGGLSEARTAYPDAPISDAGNTIFEVHGAGVDKQVLVNALGYTGDNDPDEEIRTKLEFLAIRLENFGSDVANGGGADLGEYEPEAYLITLDSYPGPAPNRDDVRGWPWPDLDLGDFVMSDAAARQLTPEQTLALVEDPLAAPDNLIVETPDGGSSFVRIRPLLPDEIVPATETT
jgi:hypothetical protein